MSITALPQPPTRSDPVNFSERADAFLSALPTFATEANELQADVNAKQIAAAASASTSIEKAAIAVAAADAAISSANATIWLSTESYAVGESVISPISFFTYRKKTSASTITDPSLDETNWQLVSGDVVADAAQNISNKNISESIFTVGEISESDINSSNITSSLISDYSEQVSEISGLTPALSPSNGGIQTWVLTDNSSPTQGTWLSGQSITLMIDDGSSFTINWSSLSVTWKTDRGLAPILNTSGFTVISLWKVNSVIYGARVGNA